MVRPDRLEQPVVGSRAARPLGLLLKPALRALQRDRRECCVDLGRGDADQPLARGVPAEVEQDRAGESLEARRQDRRPAPPRAGRLALAEGEVAAEVDPLGESGEAGGADDRGPPR